MQPLPVPMSRIRRPLSLLCRSTIVRTSSSVSGRVIRHIGMSSHNPKVAKKAAESGYVLGRAVRPDLESEALQIVAQRTGRVGLDDHVREPQPEPVLAHERRDGPRLPRLVSRRGRAVHRIPYFAPGHFEWLFDDKYKQRREQLRRKKSFFRKISGPNPTNYPQYVANETGSRNSFSCRFALCPLPPCPRPARFRMEFFRARFTAFETVLRDFLPDCAG